MPTLPCQSVKPLDGFKNTSPRSAAIPERLPCELQLYLSLDIPLTGHHESWGESAGAISVALHMIANEGNTEGLFHGAFMESGAVIPAGDMTLGQQDYDNLVQAVGCTGANDTLECLRQASFSTLKDAVNSSPGVLSYRVCHNILDSQSPVVNDILQSLNITWGPRADGTFLKAPLQQLLLQGNVANVPFVTGTNHLNPHTPCH